MKHLSILGVLFMLLASCGGGGSDTDKKKKVDKDALFGSFSGDTYSNPFFNFKVDFNGEWKVDSTAFQMTLGGTLFEAECFASSYRDFPANIEAKVDKANPFAPPSVKKQALESREGYDMLFDARDLIKTPFYKTEIAGAEYLVNEMALIQEGDTSYIYEYYRYKDKYFLSIECVANSASDKDAIQGLIKGFKKL